MNEAKTTSELLLGALGRAFTAELTTAAPAADRTLSRVGV